jgi:hypothetical protein
MGERLRFGIDSPERIRQTKAGQPAAMFPDGADLPLFSGTPVPAVERPFVPEDHGMKQALLTGMPPEVHAVLDALSLMLRPVHREQVKSPQDIAAVFMLEMAHLDQEQLRVVCLNTKNRLRKIHLVYQGSLNASMIRVGEIYKEPLRLNSAAIIVAHNHPSGEPIPSPEDVLVTREIVEAGKLLDVECLDHLVIGQGKWVSMREKGLGGQ